MAISYEICGMPKKKTKTLYRPILREYNSAYGVGGEHSTALEMSLMGI